MVRQLMWIIWPGSFMAIPAVGVVFSLFDPEEMHFFGSSVDVSRMGVYTLGFLLIWAFGASCSAMTCLLQRTPPEINRGIDGAADS